MDRYLSKTLADGTVRHRWARALGAGDAEAPADDGEYGKFLHEPSI